MASSASFSALAASSCSSAQSHSVSCGTSLSSASSLSSPSYTYHGHFTIGGIIGDYVGDGEGAEAFEKDTEYRERLEDIINLFFTSIDPLINCFRNPKELANALGNWKWRQIIDGEEIDPQVYDTGRNRQGEYAQPEPGYLASCLDAATFSELHLGKRPTVLFYKHLHAIACQHFDGSQQGPPLKAKDADRFIDPRRALNASYDRDMPFFATSGIKKRQFYTYDDVNKRMSTIRGYVVKIFGKMEPFVSPGFIYGKPTTDYCYSSEGNEKKREKIVQGLFEEYTDNIQKAKTSHQKLRVIANLFQMLEWLHPFPDGQGRTDILFLTKLLVENGFSPFILYNPYVSSVSLLSEWVFMLKEGMKEWQKCLCSLQQTNFKSLNTPTWEYKSVFREDPKENELLFDIGNVADECFHIAFTSMDGLQKIEEYQKTVKPFKAKYGEALYAQCEDAFKRPIIERLLLEENAPSEPTPAPIAT